MRSVKTKIEPTVYDDAVTVEETSFETCRQEAVKKRQESADLENACQRDVVFLRRMSAIAIVALLTAAAALFLAISAMKGEHNYAHSYEVAKFHQ